MLRVCDNVPTNLASPGAGQIVSTITLTLTANITGTIVFSIKPTDIGAQPVKVFNPNPVVAPATVTWTSTIPGNPVARTDAISLFITQELLKVLYTLYLYLLQFKKLILYTYNTSFEGLILYTNLW